MPRFRGAILVGGTLTVLLVGCSVAATHAAGGPGASSRSSSVSSAATSRSTTGSRSVSTAACAGTSCAVTLTGEGAEAEVLGTHIAFVGLHEGRATVRVGDRTVSCVAGQTLPAGRMRLRCTGVTEDTVTFTGTLG